ncbi:MAG: hypothetical protein IPG02_05050 [Ignavibacteria bacterium]|nr:hypothetical protein [Ignavibacteria bacterium]
MLGILRIRNYIPGTKAESAGALLGFNPSDELIILGEKFIADSCAMQLVIASNSGNKTNINVFIGL